MGHICFCHKDIGNIDRGGLCTLFKTLMRGLVEKGWTVSCLTQRKLDIEGVNAIRLPEIENCQHYSQTVAAALQNLRPDIAECSNWRAELAEFVNRGGNSRTAVVVRSDPSPQTLFGNDPFFDMEKELYQRADKVIAVSEFAKRDIEKIYQISEVEVVYNAIDETALMAFVPKQVLASGSFRIGGRESSPREIVKVLNDESTKIFWCGKTTLMKGFDYLEKIVLRASPNLTFIVNIGNSPPEVVWSDRALNKTVLASGLERSDQLSVWKHCDVFLSTSRVEGFGLALLEGLILGLPVIANTQCSVFHEFLPNRNLFLTEVKDADAVLDAIENVKDMASPGPDLANLRFTRNRLITESEQIYRELVKK